MSLTLHLWNAFKAAGFCRRIPKSSFLRFLPFNMASPPHPTPLKTIKRLTHSRAVKHNAWLILSTKNLFFYSMVSVTMWNTIIKLIFKNQRYKRIYACTQRSNLTVDIKDFLLQRLVPNGKIFTSVGSGGGGRDCFWQKNQIYLQGCLICFCSVHRGHLALKQVSCLITEGRRPEQGWTVSKFCICDDS